jgi:DNA-binding transcriptional LysR family regulator
VDTLDPDLLRTFLAFADSGSLAQAASLVGRSPSAVTAQMQRLQDLIGEPLMEPAGRGRTLTLVGEELVGHARRILSAHREAWLSIKGARADGQIALGCTQDFAERGLPELLRIFARSHSRIRIDLRIGRSQELAAAFEQGRLDILLAMRTAPVADATVVIREPMIWVEAAAGLVASDVQVPLALLDPPCGFRNAAIAALDEAARPYRIAATSHSLAGLLTAVRSGIAVTPRTRRALDMELVEASPDLALPPLPDAEFVLRARSTDFAPSRDLAALLTDGLVLQPA